MVDFELVHRRAFAWGSLEGGIGYADVSNDGGVALRIEDGVRGHVSWRHEWR